LNIPVIPMHLDGLFGPKKKEQIFVGPGKVHVTIGAPVRFRAEQQPEEIAEDLEQRVRALQRT
jgi:1-acyl-sn-glycerol-3-phosphate acyltransferase